MKAVSQTYKDNIKKLGKEIDYIIAYKINNVNYELGAEDLNSATLCYEGDILKSVMKQLTLDSIIDIPIGTTIKYQFGLKVDNQTYDETNPIAYRVNYEYIDYGNFIVYSIEKQENTNSYKIVCYDKMLKAMTDYHQLYIDAARTAPISYPITIKDFLKSICYFIEVDFALSNSTFVNYNQQILNELYLDSDGNSLDYTFRDVLDEIAQATASTICIDDNDKLTLRYINNTNTTIDGEYLKDVNVNFGEVYGPINTITFKRSADSDVVTATYPPGLPVSQRKEIVIKDNQILSGNNRTDYLQPILTQLYGLVYYTNDFTSTGITYYELCDKYHISITQTDNEGNTTTTNYPCVMLNDEIQVSQGLQENVHTDKPDESKTDYNTTTKDDRESSRASLIVDKAKGQIASKVGKDEIISTINQSAEQVQIDASKISLTGKTIALTGDNINITGTNFSVDNSGNMSATSGTIGGFHIESDRLWNKVRVRDYSMEDVYGASTYVLKWDNWNATQRSEFLQQYGFSNEAEMLAKWDVNGSGTITTSDVMNMATNYVDYSASGISLVAGANNTPGSIQLSGPYSDKAVTISADGSITLNKIPGANENKTLVIDALGITGDTTLTGDLDITGDLIVEGVINGSIENAVTASKLGSSTVGGSSTPIYLNSGTATSCYNPASANWFRGVARVDSNGYMEIGRYIDFHPTNASTLDYSKRIDAGTGTTARVLTLPDKTGTLACTSDIPTLPSTTTGTLTINKDSDSNSTATGTYAKYGNVVCYDITLSTTASTAGGGDVFKGSITNYTPKKNTVLVGYVGVRPMIGSFTTDKKLVVRNASASSLGANSTPSIRGTFII